MVNTEMLKTAFDKLGLSENLEGIPILESTDIADAVIYSLKVPHRVQVCRYYLGNNLMTSIYIYLCVFL